MVECKCGHIQERHQGGRYDAQENWWPDACTDCDECPRFKTDNLLYLMKKYEKKHAL